jgi:SMODS and SLOG-associating 2TM effector domain family 4
MEQTAQDAWISVQPLLEQWLKRARENQLQHWESARHYENLNYRLGIPVVILSTTVGTTVFATLQKQVRLSIQIAVGAISMLTAILAGLQTFLRFSERAEKHRSVAASYSAIRRRIETLLKLPVELKGDTATTVAEVEKQLDELAKASPNVPERIWNRIQEQVAKPETHSA